MTASSLYKIMDSFSAYDKGVWLTVDGKEVESVTLEFVNDDGDDYRVTSMNIRSATIGRVCAV